MASQRLDENLLTFIDGAVPSVWALEALIMLRDSPRHPWLADQLVDALRASPSLVDELLGLFETAGLVQRQDAAFLYSPPSAAVDDLCQSLQEAYRERPVAVMSAIVRRHAKAARAAGLPHLR